jgi:hypothetical protein
MPFFFAFGATAMKKPIKTRRQENIRFVVKWIENNTMYFRAYKRDYAAVNFQNYLIEQCGVDPCDVRIVSK